MILMWYCPGNMPKYYLDKTTLLYKYCVQKCVYKRCIYILSFPFKTIFTNRVSHLLYGI